MINHLINYIRLDTHKNNNPLRYISKTEKQIHPCGTSSYKTITKTTYILNSYIEIATNHYKNINPKITISFYILPNKHFMHFMHLYMRNFIYAAG